MNKKSQKAGSKMAIQKIMLELILITPQTPVARPITILGAILQYLQSFFEDNQPKFTDTLGKASTAG
jgi:hypothetical protein